jgi:taurine dioxygenase
VNHRGSGRRPAMALALSMLGSHMAVAASGIDLNTIADADAAARLHQGLLDHLVLCIREQALSPLAYREAMRVFGDPLPQTRISSQHPEVPEIMILSSADRDDLGDGGRLVVGAHWHTDDSYKAVPCSLTMLYGVAVPETGGDTQFANMYAAYDGLDAATKQRIEGLKAIHQYDSSRKGTRIATLTSGEAARLPAVAHPLVRTHPETGRRALYLNPNRMEAIVGLDRAASDELLDTLIAHAIQPRYQYRHRWQKGDILIWDNRCTMHKANADYPEGATRLMQRIIVAGTVPV